jgi:2'-5' RNA ligase
MESTEYTVSIRITLPEELTAIIMREKNRFVSEYNSGYKSEAHITLYLSRYIKEGFPKLITDLRKFTFKPFDFSLLEAKTISEGYRNLYFIDVSNKEQLEKLHIEISKIASPYKSPLLREKDRKRVEQSISIAPRPFTPHITLGEVISNAPQPDIVAVKKNVAAVEGKKITVSNIVVFFYKKEDGAEKAEMIEEVKIPLAS